MFTRRGFRRHRGLFVAGALALILANWAIGGAWWSFWPLAAWGVLLGAHYLVHKARTIDDAWVDARTADLRSKSYDASHIDAIKKDSPRAAPPPER